MNLERRIEALEKAIFGKEKTELRVRVPDEKTPMNTVVRFVNDGPLFFWRGENRVSASPFGVGLPPVDPNSYRIDTIADLRFRMFLNAPKNMKWGAIDKDGVGTVFEERPSKGIKQWEIAGSDYLQVGHFPQYADEWDKILIEREG